MSMFPSSKGKSLDNVSSVSLAESSTSALDDVLADAMKKREDSDVGKIRGILQVTIRRGKTEGGRGVGEFQCDVEMWYYHMGGGFLDSRKTVRLCPRHGCHGYQSFEDAAASAPDYLCKLCNTYCTAEQMKNSVVFYGSKARVARHIERMWLQAGYHGCDIYAVVQHSDAMRKLQADGVYGGMNKFEYARALKKSRRVTQARYAHSSLMQDIANGSSVQARIEAFMKEL